jgi:hypothetical protein
MTTTTSQIQAPVTAREHRRGLVVTGLIAAVAAAATTTVLAALAMAVGVDFELPDGGESIPLLGFTQLTFMFSLVGIGIAAAVRRWSSQPARTFLRITLALTAISLVPPFLVDANPATVVSLLVIHLAAAAVVIPVLVRRLTV